MKLSTLPSVLLSSSCLILAGAGCANAPQPPVANTAESSPLTVSTSSEEIPSPASATTTPNPAPSATAVPSKPLSVDAPVRADMVNAPNLALPSAKPPSEPEPSPVNQPSTPPPSPLPEVTTVVPEPSVKQITVTAKNWEFSPAIIRVNMGDKVKLEIKSIDVTHGFSLPDFNVRVTLEPGATKTAEFVADKVGNFTFSCNVFCGDGHGAMRGTLVVEE